MVFKRKLLVLGAALVLGGANGASAADLYSGPYAGGLKDSYGPVETHRSWYMRLDGGYSWNETPDVTETETCGTCSTTYDLSNVKFDDTWSLGGGVGMHFTTRIRGDITYDHRFTSDVSGAVTGSTINMDGTRQFGLQSDLLLANLYYDFDFGQRFTPYLGAGIGFVHHRTESGTVTDPCGCGIGAIDTGSSNDFAAALMAGVSFNLWKGEQAIGGGMKDAPVYVDSGRKLALDFGYRYLFLGDAETGPVTRTVTGVLVSDDPTVHDIRAHELRVGLRYDIN